MRIISLLKLGLGAAAVAAVVTRRKRPARGTPAPADYAPDPDDPVQSLGEEPFTEDLGVDAQSAAEIAADLDGALRDSDNSLDPALDPAIDPAIDAAEVSAGDTGDLYGVHVPAAVETAHLDDDAAFDQGQNWLEALETDAVEYGAEPERELGIFDDADLDAAPHPSDTRDTPVADRGAGGPAGV